MIIFKDSMKSRSVNSIFGKRLAQLRKARGITQQELGNKIGVSKRAIAYYEGETHNPPANKLDSLAKALDVTIEELLGTKPLKNKPTIKNRKLLQGLNVLEKLPKEDQKSVLSFIDALSIKRKVNGSF